MADHARFVDENLKRNYRANFIHGVLGMTGFRLIYAPTIIPAYLLLLTGSTAAVGLGSALLQLGATISPIASAHGPSGANRDYLLNLADALRGLGHDDPHVFALEERLLTGE